MLALNAKPSTAQTRGERHAAADGTARAARPTAPHAAQPSICCGVQIPWPRKRFETKAASAPVATPARRPSDAPATTAITVTGCTPGIAAKSTRPAAAAAPSVATTASSRVESAPDSNHATPAATSAGRAEQRRERAVVDERAPPTSSADGDDEQATHGRPPAAAARPRGRPRRRPTAGRA